MGITSALVFMRCVLEAIRGVEDTLLTWYEGVLAPSVTGTSPPRQGEPIYPACEDLRDFVDFLFHAAAVAHDNKRKIDFRGKPPHRAPAAVIYLHNETTHGRDPLAHERVPMNQPPA